MITNEKLKRYLPVLATLNNPVAIFEDAIDVASSKIENLIIGEELYSTLENNSDLKLVRLVERAICSIALLDAIPELDMVMTDMGFAVVNSENYTPASRARVDKLIEGLSVKADRAIDELVVYLYKHIISWRESSQFDYFTQAIVYSYSDYRLYVGAVPSAARTWREFYDKIPFIYSALIGPVASYISQDYVDEIVERIRDDERISVNDNKVIELVKAAVCLLSAEQREGGMQKIMVALKIMRANITDFPTYAGSLEAKAVDIQRVDGTIFGML